MNRLTNDSGKTNKKKKKDATPSVLMDELTANCKQSCSAQFLTIKKKKNCHDDKLCSVDGGGEGGVVLFFFNVRLTSNLSI